mmetsp:Transcript_14820/g.60545  ORF Transcript_14820/g.60545 Transcript_14820/m.60545 type:complete len:328 (+) Transcript_14820:216-1199(+)
MVSLQSSCVKARAFTGGARDNMSVVMMRQGMSRAPELAFASPRRKNRWWLHAKNGPLSRRLVVQRSSRSRLGRKFLFSSRLPSAGESEVIGDKLVGRVIDEPRRRPGAALGVPRARDGARRHRRAMTLWRLAPVVRDIPPLGHDSLVPDHHDDGLVVHLVGIYLVDVGLRGRVPRDEPGKRSVVVPRPSQRSVQSPLVVAFAPRVMFIPVTRVGSVPRGSRFSNLSEGCAVIAIAVVVPSSRGTYPAHGRVVASRRRVAEPSLAGRVLRGRVFVSHLFVTHPRRQRRRQRLLPLVLLALVRALRGDSLVVAGVHAHRDGFRSLGFGV